MSASPRRSWRHRLRRIAVLVVASYATWLVVLFFVQRAILFPRFAANHSYAPPPPSVEVWSDAHADGVASQAWFLPAKADGPAPAIVLVHGNAMLVNDWLDWAESLSDRGVHVLLPEFRGYGITQGSPSRDALVEDLARAMVRLANDPRVDPSRVLVYGRSIGGAIAAEAAVRAGGLGAKAPAQLVLHTAPARIRDMSWQFAAPPFLVRDPFDTLSAVAALASSTRITVIGHDRDEVVSPNDAARIAAAAGVEPTMLAGTHNGFATTAATDEFLAIIEGLMIRLGARSSDRRGVAP